MVREMSPRPNLISEKITTEALFQAMQKQEVTDPQHLLAEYNTGFVFADELATFLNKHSYEQGLAPVLIKLYDCSPVSYRTIGRGEEVMDHPCLGMLGASTVDWIRAAIPSDAVGGGLTSRMMFIYCDTPCDPVPWPVIDDKLKLLREMLIQRLNFISSLEGPCKLTVEALALYKKHYIEFRDSPMWDDQALQGYASRRFIHALKIAMLFSVAERSDKVVTERHMKGAIDLLYIAEKQMPLVLRLITSSDMGVAVTRVYGIIQIKRKISRSELISLVGHQYSTKNLAEILETLIAMRKLVQFSEGNQLFYGVPVVRT
jgi:hypothetical protein